MAFYDTKDWYKSKTIWAGLLTTILAFASMFGFVPGFEASTVVEAVFALLGVFGIYGRVTATTQIGAKQV